MQALKQCDSDAYPNLSVLLKITGTVAVRSCEFERSGRVSKHLNAYLRASMRQERLSGLALIHINYDVEISVDRVMSIFDKKPRPLEFQEHLFFINFIKISDVIKLFVMIKNTNLIF